MEIFMGYKKVHGEENFCWKVKKRESRLNCEKKKGGLCARKKNFCWKGSRDFLVQVKIKIIK